MNCMYNIFFPDECISEDDLKFMCVTIERIARTLKQPNKYIVNTLGYNELVKKISLANVLHCLNPLQTIDDFVKEYHLEQGGFDITKVDKEFADNIPTVIQMGKVYYRLILSTLESNEDYVQGIIRVYNHPICEILDNYNASAYYEPSYVIERAYYNDGCF